MSCTILLAEDDQNLGFVIKDQLEDEGFEVILAEDGQKALHFFDNNTISLCIFDIMMPKLDGYSLTKEIRVIDQNIPILFLSAKSITSDKIEGFKVGGDDYLTKPFSMEELILRINALLKRSNDIVSSPNQSTYEIGSYQFNVDNYILSTNEFEKKLTKKEAKILKILAQNLNQVIERDILLQHTWGKNDYFVGRSLDVFITKLRKYLAKDSSIQIINIHGVGFKLEVNK